VINLSLRSRFTISSITFLTLVSCSTSSVKPCTLGGQPARDEKSQFKGIKRCYQMVNSEGQLVNHGKYYEWYNNDKLALTGEYKNGKKNGRWTEYDESGKKKNEKYFEDGKEVFHP
jgi:hypothetical protein